MSNSIAELSKIFNELVTAPENLSGEFSTIDSPDTYTNTSLIFISEEAALPDFSSSFPAAIVTNSSIASRIEAPCAILITKNVRLAQALIKQHYQDYDVSDPEWDALHSSAVVHPTAQLSEGVRIGPNVVIGAHVEIGRNTVVRAGTVIESATKIGADCVINSLVNIGQGSIIGKRVIVRPGTVIGGEGFGFAQDSQNRYQRVPHTGVVVIEDDVQIGSNCNIDRATYGRTLIRRGVKIDALCHVAHNCTIGEDTLLIAQSGLAGSSKLGERVICSGHTGVLDHKSVADDVVLVHRCGVTEDITEPGMWAGTPAKPFKEYVRNLNLIKKIDKLERELKHLKKTFDA